MIFYDSDWNPTVDQQVRSTHNFHAYIYYTSLKYTFIIIMFMYMFMCMCMYVYVCMHAHVRV